MIKIYKTSYSISVDGKPWRRACGLFEDAWKTCWRDKEEPEESIILNSASFENAYDFLDECHYISGVQTGKTFFKKNPKISIMYFDSVDWIDITKCNSFSLKQEYKEITYVTFEWIMKNLPIDLAIQYLKERGMEICSITKTK